MPPPFSGFVSLLTPPLLEFDPFPVEPLAGEPFPVDPEAGEPLPVLPVLLPHQVLLELALELAPLAPDVPLFPALLGALPELAAVPAETLLLVRHD